MIEKSTSSLKLLAARSIVTAHFKRLQQLISSAHPSYVEIDQVMRQTFTTDPDLQDIINSVYHRVLRLSFWPIMIEMFKDSADAIMSGFSRVKNSEDDITTITITADVQTILEKNLHYKFSLESSKIFYDLFTFRAKSIGSLKGTIVSYIDYNAFTKNEIEVDFERSIWTPVEYLEKKGVPYLKSLLEAKNKAVLNSTHHEISYKNENKLGRFFDIACSFGSNKVLTLIFDLVSDNKCRYLLTRGSQHTAIHYAAINSHSGTVKLLLEKCQELLPSTSDLSIFYYKELWCLLELCVKGRDILDGSLLEIVFKSCLAISIPMENNFDSPLLSQQSFPLDPCPVEFGEGQTPMLQVIADMIIRSKIPGYAPYGYSSREHATILTQFLCKHLCSIDELEKFTATIMTRFHHLKSDSNPEQNNRALEFINSIVSDLKSNLSEKGSGLHPIRP